MSSRKAALALSAVVALTGCGTQASVPPPMPRPALRISTRSTAILSTFLSLPQFSAQAVTIGDSQKRLEALQAGSLDVATVGADVAYLAFNGRIPDHSAPLQKIRGMALMNSAVVHLLVAPNVNPSRGLRGMRIVLGDPTNSDAALGAHLVNSTGVSMSEVHGELAPTDAAVERLLKGDVDAVIVTAPLGQEAVARAVRGGARLLEINGPEVDRLRVYYPLLRQMLLQRGTYAGQDRPVHTVGVDLLLVCRADLDNELVYELTRALFEEPPRRLQRQVDPQRAPATVIPLHPGAARYYRERELNR
jgi:TRAP transporter TAXI family solute receptor